MVGWQRQAESSELADGFARRHRQGLRKAYGLAAATRRLEFRLQAGLTVFRRSRFYI